MDALILLNIQSKQLWKLNLSLEIIDGVYPNTEWHVGILGWVALVVSDRQIPLKDDRYELYSQSWNYINIPEELLDAIIIIISVYENSECIFSVLYLHVEST